MKMLRCQNCNAALAWDGASSVVTCECCGMRYQMTPPDPRRTALQNALKGGCVAPRPFLEGSDRGNAVFESWLPEGWNYTIITNDLSRYGSASTPFVPTIRMCAPDGHSLIDYTSTNAYVDAPQMGFGANPMGGFMAGFAQAFGAAGSMGAQGYLDPQTYVRKRPLTRTPQLCDEAALARTQLFGLQLQQVMQETDAPDAIARTRYQELLQDLPPETRQSIWCEWHRRLYRALAHDGSEYAVMAEVEVATNGFNTQAPQQQPSGGLFANMLGQAAQAMAQSAQPRIWQTTYELVMWCPIDEFPRIFAECNHVRESIQQGADFQTYREALGQAMQFSAMQTQSAVTNAQMNMMRDNATHADRMAAITQDLNDHVGNVMHDMMASNAATNERVANMHAEMVGGYNVYRGTDGNYVRADTAFDHVYQGNVDGRDWLVGVEGDWLEPGVDFVPLDKIEGGNY